MLVHELASTIDSLSRLFSSRGFSLSIRKVYEKDLYGAIQEFRILHVVSEDLSTVFIIRIRDDGVIRFHLVKQFLEKPLIEDLVSVLEDIGYRVSLDKDLLTATIYTTIDNVYKIADKTIECLTSLG